MTIIPNLIKLEQNSIEFYTVVETGRSGMSQAGLAKLCGVQSAAIYRFEATLSRSENSQASEVPAGGNSEALTLSRSENSQALTLLRNGEKAIVNGKESGNLKVYCSNFCIAAIKHYSEKGKKEAIFSLMKFAELGFETWVQQITGWKPPQTEQLTTDTGISVSTPQIEPQIDLEIPISTPQPQPILEPSPPEHPEEPSLHPTLQFIQDAIALGDQLGGFDSDQQAIVRAKLAKAIQVAQLSEMILPASVEPPQQYTIAERAFVLGHRISAGQAVAAGKVAAELYRQKHKKNPPQRLTNYKDGVTYVNVYSGRDLTIADTAIQTIVDRGY